MPLDSIYCFKDRDLLHLINLESLGVITIPSSKIASISRKINEQNDEKIQEFITADSFLKTLKPSTTSFSIDPLLVLSFKCNYHCDYCYQEGQKNIHDQLSEEDLTRIDEFYNLYCDHYHQKKQYGCFTLIGGEPLLPQNKNILECIFRKWKDQEFSIKTNGTYIEEYIDLLKKYNVSLQVSLDGTREMHYERRHTKDLTAYDRTISGVKSLMDSQIPVIISTVYNPKNLEKYSDFFDEMESYGWLSSPYLKLVFIPEVGKGCDDISTEYLHSTSLSLIKLKELDPRISFVTTRRLVPGANALRKAIFDAERDHSYYPYRCSLLEEPAYSFLPNGDVMLCLAIENLEGLIGSYKPEIKINFEKIDQLKLHRIDKMPKCFACKLKILCKGGCIATSINKLGNCEDPYCGIWQKPNFLDYVENVIGNYQNIMEKKYEKDFIDW